MKTSHQIGMMVSMVLSCLLLLTACFMTQTPIHSTTSSLHQTTEQPQWLKHMIDQAQAQPHWLQAIYILEHQGQTYYMAVPGCCDRISVLYNTQGQKICSPSGGFTGRGDGKCGDIHVRTLPKNKIWPKKSA